MNLTNYKPRINSFLIILIFCFLISSCVKTETKSPSPPLRKGESKTQPAKEKPEKKATEEKPVNQLKNSPAPFPAEDGEGTKGEKTNEKPINRQKNPPTPFTKGGLLMAYNKFGCLLFNEVFKPEKNTFVSSISISLALAMTYNGAEKETKDEMASTLNVSGFEISSFNRANEDIIKQLTSESEGLKLSIANSLWARENEPFKKPFLDIARKFYQAEIENVDFLAPETVPRINGWVEKKTQEKIKNLLSKQDINKDTLLVLINAIYFKGNWQSPFKKRLTKKQDFFLSDGTAKKVDMMSNSEEYLYFESPEYQAVQLPYSEGDLKMVIFLPGKSSSLKKFLENFSEEKWKKWMTKFGMRNGTVSMPKFKMEFEVELKKVLSKLGMPTAFDRRNANFKKMCELKPGENISIDKVKHKAFIEVNEEGTEAAAATAVVMIRTTSIGPGKIFRMVIDRPFFFAICDSRSQAILFMGTVYEP